MIILPGNKTPDAIYYGVRPIKSVYVGAKLVWPEAKRFGIRSVSLCKTHSAFILNDGTFWTCGSNFYGQLCRTGVSGSWNSPNLEKVPGIEDAVAVAVSCTASGEGSTIVLREHGRLFSGGASPALTVSATNKIAYTALGRQSVSGSPTFCNFAEVLGTSYVKKAWHGQGRLFIQRTDGAVYGYGLDWDANRATLMWMPARDSLDKPLVCSDLSAHANNIVALRDGGKISLLGPIADWHRPSEFPASQTSVLQPYADESFLAEIRKFSSGQSHLGAVGQDGHLRMAGSDRYGQLASTKFQYRNPYHGYLLEEKGSDVACGDYHTVILDRTGRVRTAGRNDRGQLGRAVPVGNGHDWLYHTGKDRVSQEGWFGNVDYVPDIEDAVAIYAGGDSTIVVRRSGIDVFGDNEFGQLGVATERHVVNSGDRITWRENWQGNRTPFLTNHQNAILFPDKTL